MAPHGQTVPHDPPGVIKLYLIQAARLLAWGAYGALVYVVLVRGLQLARDTAFPLTIGKIGWGEVNPPINIWFPLFPVAFALAGLLPLATKYCIAFIVSIKGKDPLSRWAKGILTVITLACIVSTLTATGPLMIESAGGKYREAAVKGELVEARLNAEKQIYADMQTSLDKLKTASSYEGAAAREGVAGWSAKVAIAKKQLDAGQLDQWRYDRIERAGSAAAAREDLERQMRDQQVKIASLPTASTAVASVKSEESHGAQEFAETTSAWWPLVSFFALEMIAVFFGLIQLVLEMTRDRQLAEWEAAHTKEEDGGILRLEDQIDRPQVMPQDFQRDEFGRKLIKYRFGYNPDGSICYKWRLAPGEKARTQEEADAQAAAFDGAKRNPADWFVRHESDSRAPVANQVEQSDGTGENIPGADRSNPSEAEFISEPVGVAGDSDDRASVGNEADSFGSVEHVDETSPLESEPVGEGQGELDEGSNGAGMDEKGHGDSVLDVGGSELDHATMADGDSMPLAGVDVLGTEESLTDAAPLQTPDEPITWDQEDEPSEPQEPEYHDQDPAAVSYTQEQIDELERQWAVRKGLPAPTEAAE